jgi:O-antigen ligase/polysaccharide polymerase Wzy-like membrane protein
VPPIERASKTAATTSVLLILALMLAVHPDMTWLLRGLTIAALVGGWFVFALGLGFAAPVGQAIFWLFVAAIAPALLRLLAGREGPVLDIVWLAGLAGSLLRTTQWSRWTMPFPWNVLIGGWTLALSLSWPVLVAREIGFRLSGFHDAGAINSWSLMPAPQAAVWILYVVLAQLIGALWFEWVREKAAQLKSPILLMSGLWAGATVSSIVAVVQGTLDIGFLSTEFWASLRRATGTMLDANSYGVCAALAAPIGFLGMRVLAPHAPAAAVAVFAINFAGMWLSGSRTALFTCGLIGAAALMVGLWRERRTPTSAMTQTAMWSTVGVIAVLAVVLVTATASPIQRALDIPSGREGLASLWNRGGYGPIALRMTREFPLTGVGAGSYRILAPDYWRAMANDALPLDNAQNWWRHQIAELGVFGGALIIAFSVLVAWRAIAGRERDSDVVSASTVRGLLIGLGVTSFFGMPTQNPLVLYWFLGLVAWFGWLVPDPPLHRDTHAREPRVAWVVAAALAVAYAAGHVVLAAGPLNPAQRAQRASRDYVIGAYPPEPLPEGNEFRWTGRDARFIWAAKTRYMAIRLWAHHPDIASKPVHVTVTSPCGLLFDEDLTSDASMSLGIALPEGQRTLEATVRVSRTWSPADAGEPDERRLGVGIVADFSKDPAFATSQLRAVTLSGCGAGI